MSEFEAKPAVRVAQNLFIGLVGPSSSGKTYTSLELAMGIQSVVGGDIAMVDTEEERGLQPADYFKKPDGSPGYLHIKFPAPWSSLRYIDAIKYAATKAKTVIVDSGSHEHDGVGGMLDFQEQEVRRMAGDDWQKAERVKMLAWAKPKAARRELLRYIASSNVNLIMCFRAKNTSKPGKDDRGKTIVIPQGFVPIAAEELVFEMALSMLFLPGARGVPTWRSEFPGENMAVKVPRQFEFLMERKGPITRETGRMLAEWARGAAPSSPGPSRQPQQENARSTPPAQEEQRSEPPAEVFTLLTATETFHFDSEMEYLEAYEGVVKQIVAGGKQSDLLLFDKANAPNIAKHPSLDPVLKRVNATIRPAAGQGGLGV